MEVVPFIPGAHNYTAVYGRISARPRAALPAGNSCSNSSLVPPPPTPPAPLLAQVSPSEHMVYEPRGTHRGSTTPAGSPRARPVDSRVQVIARATLTAALTVGALLLVVAGAVRWDVMSGGGSTNVEQKNFALAPVDTAGGRALPSVQRGSSAPSGDRQVPIRSGEQGWPSHESHRGEQTQTQPGTVGLAEAAPFGLEDTKLGVAEKDGHARAPVIAVPDSADKADHKALEASIITKVHDLAESLDLMESMESLDIQNNEKSRLNASRVTSLLNLYLRTAWDASAGLPHNHDDADEAVSMAPVIKNQEPIGLKNREKKPLFAASDSVRRNSPTYFGDDEERAQQQAGAGEVAQVHLPG